VEQIAVKGVTNCPAGPGRGAALLGDNGFEAPFVAKTKTAKSRGVEGRRRLAFMSRQRGRHFRDPLTIRGPGLANFVAAHFGTPNFGAVFNDDHWISNRFLQHNRRETSGTDTVMAPNNKDSSEKDPGAPLRPRDVSSQSEVDAFVGKSKQTPQSQIDAFLGKVRQMAAPVGGGKRGRLIFAMDATASREPSWDRACHLQGEMFQETDSLGGLDIQLAYYRGFGEFHATEWVSDSTKLLREMTRVHCLGGQTQIERLLRHAVAETRKEQTQAVVFVGDAFEEDIDQVCHAAGELGMLGVPVFCFHEGGDLIARRGLEQLARLTKGAYCPFDASSAKQLRELLAAVAVYAAGGRRALENHAQRKGGEALRLTHQMRN
jgi:hypothetical protein